MEHYNTIYFVNCIRSTLFNMVLLLSMLSAITQAQVTRYVDSLGNDQAGANHCDDPGNPCLTINQALNYASDGDTLRIGKGTYTGTFAINKSLTLTGERQDQTIIQANALPDTAGNRVFLIVGNADVSFRDISIRNGSLKGIDEWGGGIYNQDGTIRLSNVSVSNNRANTGGGIYNSGSAILDHVNFYRNHSDKEGGGMYNTGKDSIVLDHVEFVENYSGYGGGMSNEDSCSPVITHTEFNGNTGGYAGGMSNYNNCSPILTDVNLIGNKSNYGGGMANFTDCYPRLRNVVFKGNEADYGGGMVNQNNCSPILINVIFSGNLAIGAHAQCGGMYNFTNCSPTLINVTFNGNLSSHRGGAISNFYKSSPELINTIIWKNKCDSCTSASQTSIYNFDSLSVPVIRYSLIANSGGSGNDWQSELGIDSTHNIDADPLFVHATDPDHASTRPEDLHLLAGSPAINSGDPDTDFSFFQADSKDAPVDLDQNPRVRDGRIDMGAYEFGVADTVTGPLTVSRVIQIKSTEFLNNFPNPFSDYTTIAYQISVPEYVSIKVFDIMGNQVAEPVNETVPEGYHETPVYTDGWKPGVYYYSLQVKDHVETRQMILLK